MLISHYGNQIYHTQALHSSCFISRLGFTRQELQNLSQGRAEFSKEKSTALEDTHRDHI